MRALAIMYAGFAVLAAAGCVSNGIGVPDVKGPDAKADKDTFQV